MAIQIYGYDQMPKIAFDGTVDLNTDSLYMAMVTSSYTPSLAHTIWGDVSANEVAAGSGYSTGGVLLALASMDNSKFDVDDPTWSALTKTFRYLVVYDNVTRNGLVDPLICYILPDDTPADTVVTASDYTLPINPNGLITY